MAHVRKNAAIANRPYVADFKDDDGNRKQLSFETEKEAQKVIREAKQREHSKLPFPAFTSWYIDDLEARGIAANSIGNVIAINRNHWLPAFKGRTLGELGVAEWRQFRADLAEKGLSPGWITTICHATSHMYNRAMDEGMVATNPLIQAGKSMRKYYPALPITYPTVAETARILEASSGQIRLFLLFVVHCGLRAGEAASLRWTDIDQVASTIAIDKVRRPGGERKLPANEQRTVPLHPEVAIELEKERAVNHSPYVFKGGAHFCGNGPLGLSFFSGRIQKLMRELGLVRVLPGKREVPLYSANDLRHLAALAWKREGLSVRRIALLMGYRRVMTIHQRYRGHFRDKRDRGFVAKAAALLFKKKA